MSLKLDKIKMIEASCLSFSVSNYIQPEEIDGFSFDYAAQTKADIDSRLLLIKLKIDIGAILSKEDDEKESLSDSNSPAGSFEFGFTYQVDNLEELIQVVNGNRILDMTLHMSVLGIAFSTARGMILTRSADTLLERAYLPIVNPAHLLDPRPEI